MASATQTDPVVTLTESAASQVKAMGADNEENAGKILRVYVENGGCSGMQYGLVNPYSGFIPGLKAFTAAVLGGIGNMAGAMAGGLVLGLLEAFAASYMSLLTNGAFGAEYKDIFAFSMLILILIFRPRGLLGEVVRERA